MTLTTTTYDYSHLEAVAASRKASADALATLETIDLGKAAAAERLSNVESKLRKGDTTVTATQLRNAKDEVERYGLLHAGAALAAHGAGNAVVNLDISIADAMVSYLQGDNHSAKFPVNAVVGVNNPTAELIDPLRPVLYVQQLKPAKHAGNGYVTGECLVSFYPRTTLEKAPEKVPLLRMLQASKLEVDVDSYSPPVLGGPAATGYRIRATRVLPRIPTLRGGPDFDKFLTARGGNALTRLMRAIGLNGVVNLGVATVSGPSEVDGVTVQTVAVRVQVGCPFNSQYGRRDDYEVACLEAAQAALKVNGPQAHVGNVTVQEGGKVPTTINLPTEVRSLAGDAGVTAEAAAVFTLRYHLEDAPEDAAADNSDDVVKDANGEERYRWELNG